MNTPLAIFSKLWMATWLVLCALLAPGIAKSASSGNSLFKDYTAFRMYALKSSTIKENREFFFYKGAEYQVTQLPKVFMDELKAKILEQDNLLDIEGDDYYKIDDQIYPIDSFSSFGSDGGKWPNGIIPIEFAEGISERRKKLFFDACDTWKMAANTSIDCKERKNERGYFYVFEQSFDTNKSFSEVGYGGPRKHNMGIYTSTSGGDWNNPSVLAHEIGHAFGLIHEHQRYDRDNWLNVNFANVKGSKEQTSVDFWWRGTRKTTYLPYDSKSIMHYSSNANSINGNDTLVIAACNTVGLDIDPSKSPNEWDRATLEIMYGNYDVRKLAKPRDNPLRSNVPRQHAMWYCDVLGECTNNVDPRRTVVSSDERFRFCPSEFHANCAGNSGGHKNSACCELPMSVETTGVKFHDATCGVPPESLVTLNWNCGCDLVRIPDRSS